MKLTFICPAVGAAFESAHYRLIENQGVVTGSDGNRFLDAKVALNAPCPLCGGMHVYPASELACPWGGSRPEER